MGVSDLKMMEVILPFIFLHDMPNSFSHARKMSCKVADFVSVFLKELLPDADFIAAAEILPRRKQHFGERFLPRRKATV